jgi:uncharacterized protein with HEPN domain
MAVHEYFDVEMSQVWNTIESDLPLLIKEINNYLNKN